jgi:3-oxoacyl-[acyl-carrier protein] reductase
VSVEGKTAVVTGAAGSIGRAIVERLQRDGAQVVAVDVSEARLDALRAERDDAYRRRLELVLKLQREI